jgi:two-component system, NarL family, sensor kinase
VSIAVPLDATRARPRTGALAAGVPVLVSAVATALTVWLDTLNTAAERAALDSGHGSLSGAIGLGLTLCAAPVLHRHPRHVVGWVLGLSGVAWALDGLAESWAVHGLAASPEPPLSGFALWYVAQFGSVLLLMLPAVLVLYPSGRLLAGRWGRFSVLVLVAAAALPAVLVVAPPATMQAGIDHEYRTGMPALPLSDAVYTPVLHVAQVLTFTSVLFAVVVFVVRMRRAEGLERVQVRWLAWAAAVCVGFGISIVFFRAAPLGMVAMIAALFVTAVSVAIGILAPERWDVDALLVATIVFGSVAATVVALDLVLVAGLERVLGERLGQQDVAVLVLLLALAAYGPIRSAAGGVVRRWLVGRRGDRYDVVSGLAARLEESADVHRQLPALAAAVATAFKLGYVRVEVVDSHGTVSAAHGTAPAAVREVPIRYGEELVGRLVLPDRGMRSMLSRRDQELLLDVVRQAAVAIRSARLAADLQASRERLVLDREEDRRRIRRDLHDGLGPVLGGVAMRLDAAGNALTTDPEAARTMVEKSRSDITEALADVRRLVHGLRPPALDDLGLLDALQQQVERMRSAALDVRVEAEALPPLPAAVEVAAYRIASEALANMARHAQASHCTVRLVAGPADLLVEVADDGVGIGPDVVAGVGLGSLRDRAAELGGRTEITCPPPAGTVVRAWLPLSTPADTQEDA